MCVFDKFFIFYFGFIMFKSVSSSSVFVLNGVMLSVVEFFF